MAKQTSFIKFSGKLDGFIGFRRKHNYFIKRQPRRIRQSAATKRAAGNFGEASRRGKLIRQSFAPYLNLRPDGGLVNRLNSALIKGGTYELGHIAGFRFNQYTGVEKLLPKAPILTPEGSLQIPAQHLPRPEKYTHLEIRLVAARISFGERRTIAVSEASIIIGLHEPFDGAILHAPVAGKGALIMVLQVCACNITGGISSPPGNRKWIAADIISVTMPAEPIIPFIPSKKDGKQTPYLKDRIPTAERTRTILAAPLPTALLQRE